MKCVLLSAHGALSTHQVRRAGPGAVQAMAATDLKSELMT